MEDQLLWHELLKNICCLIFCHMEKGGLNILLRKYIINCNRQSEAITMITDYLNKLKIFAISYNFVDRHIHKKSNHFTGFGFLGFFFFCNYPTPFSSLPLPPPPPPHSLRNTYAKYTIHPFSYHCGTHTSTLKTIEIHENTY